MLSGDPRDSTPERERSTELIFADRRARGLPVPADPANPGCASWLDFELRPANWPEAPSTWFVFLIIPVGPRTFYAAINDGTAEKASTAYTWVEAALLAAIAYGKSRGWRITIGLGAATKNATGHGTLLVKRHPEVFNDVSITHGDAETTWFADQLLRQAGPVPGFHAAIIGAGGAIGALAAQQMVRHRPGLIVLVGQPDAKDAPFDNCPKRQRLKAVRHLVMAEAVKIGYPLEVVISDDKSAACRQYDVDVVVVATNGTDMRLSPEEVRDHTKGRRKGVLGLDITTPSAFIWRPEWDKHHVIVTAGCARLTMRHIPGGFDRWGHRQIGAGGQSFSSFWGCATGAGALSIFRPSGTHCVGQEISLIQADECADNLRRLGVGPAHPHSFGRPVPMHRFCEFTRAVTSR